MALHWCPGRDQMEEVAAATADLGAVQIVGTADSAVSEAAVPPLPVLYFHPRTTSLY